MKRILGLVCCAATALVGLSPIPRAIAAEQPIDIRRDPTVNAVEKVLPSVVNVATETLVDRGGQLAELLREFYGPYYRRLPPQAQYSVGSGVIIDESGFVLTNDHVVRQANRIWVKLSDGREYQADRIVTTSTSDVALLKLRGKPGEKFKAVKFAADDDLLLGETVIALGNPFGLGGSVSKGILSSKNRRPPMESMPLDIADWLQTDAAINPGNSGGPLVNLKGELIGVNVAVYREGHGIGFAIPIKRVAGSLSEIFTPEELKGLWFGAKVKAGTLPLAVLEVQPGSPAEKAGLKKGDNIITINGEIPRTFIEFSRQLTSVTEDTAIPLTISRDGARQEISVKLVAEKKIFNAAMIRQKIGAQLQEITPSLAESLRLPGQGGLIIHSVDRNSAAADAGMEPGMIVRAINGQVIEEVTTAAKLLNTRKSGDKLTFSVVVERSRGNIVWHDAGDIELKVK